MPTSIIHESDVLHGLQEGGITLESRAKDVAHPIGGLIYPKAQLEELFRIFETDHVAIVVDSNELVGVISKIDLIDYLSKRNPRGAAR
jgi:cystathionine beta-synthase